MKKFVIALVLLLLAQPAFAAERKTTYDRVLKTQTIRYGYGTAKPWIYQDLKTGQMLGLHADLIREVAKQLGFKVSFPEEIGWGALPTALDDGRVDVALLWADPARGKQVAFTRPLFYTTVNAYARADETRFTGKREEMNSPNVRIAVEDGDMSIALAQRYFPRAQLVTLPAGTPFTDVLLNVTTRKADVTFLDAANIEDFNKAQKTKLKKIPLAQPLAVYGNALGVSIHEPALRDMLDTTVQYMLTTGELNELTAKFRQEHPDEIIMPVKAY